MLAPILTFILFVCGLLAWRLQLLDKRRFEVAEQILVLHAKLTQQISFLRTRPNWEDFHPATIKGRRDHYRQMRRWYYSIPSVKLAAWEEVYKEHAPAVVLAGLYLTDEIRDRLILTALYFEQVRIASVELARIEPEPSIDKEFLEEPRPALDEEENDDDAMSELEMQQIEQSHLPIRFWSLREEDEDPIQDSIRRDSQVLDKLCKPYKSMNPWKFLQRFALMFIPSHQDKI